MFMCLCLYLPYFFSFFFFFNDTATTEIYTLSLHDALPISVHVDVERDARRDRGAQVRQERAHPVDGVDDVGARLAEQDQRHGGVAGCGAGVWPGLPRGRAPGEISPTPPGARVVGDDGGGVFA